MAEQWLISTEDGRILADGDTLVDAVLKLVEEHQDIDPGTRLTIMRMQDEEVTKGG